MIIIKKLFYQQEIDGNQKRQLYRLCNEFNLKLVTFYKQSREQHDLQVFTTGCLSLVKALPLDPPPFSLPPKQIGYEFTFLSVDVVKEVIILVNLLEEKVISDSKCLYYILKSILYQPFVINWTGNILHSLHYSLQYPLSEINCLLYYCLEVGFLSYSDYSSVISLCSQHSLSLYYCFTCFLRCKSSLQFIQFCTDCLLNSLQYYKDRKLLLSVSNHNRILHDIIERDSLSVCEIVVIRQEYEGKKNNVFYEAFTVYEREQNLDELIIVLKQLVKIFIGDLYDCLFLMNVDLIFVFNNFLL